jgi:hypothetical protein
MILPDLFGGHLLMTGDNTQQNYPLHVLVGSMLTHGQLPFWNPFIFGGSPLLAGFNAGAFFPLTGLFVILPDRVAWIALEVILYSVIAIGMYVYLRALGLRTMACFLAAVTFAFAGTVLSQVNHVDMTEGFAALPWMLLAVLYIVRDGRWRWSILLGIGLALVILGGAPEAMLDEALLVAAYAIVSAALRPASWWRVLTRVAAGAALGLSLAAIQWLPGLSAIANSQRSGFGGSFAGGGSFPPRDGVLALVPYLFGGYGHLGESGFFSHYNLPELGIYLGILPVLALLALLHPAWPSRLPARERLAWYIVGLFALLLALGANTPLEHIFNAIPLYGHQRLQSRNMVGVCAAISVLFAGWLDRRTDTADSFVAYDRWMGLVPFGLVLGLSGWAIWAPNSLIRSLAQTTPFPREVHTVRVASLYALAFCAVAAVVVWLRPRLSGRAWMAAAAVFVFVDVGLMAATSQFVKFPSNDVVSGTTSVERALAANLSPGGRFDIFDPQQYSVTRFANGLPDDNILAGLLSVGGYASIVNHGYNTITESHTGGDLNVTALAEGKLDDLDLQDLLTLPEYFLVPLASTPTALALVSPMSESGGTDVALPMGYRSHFSDPDYPTYPPPRGALHTGATETWFFGESLAPTQATSLFSEATSAGALVRFGKVLSNGKTKWGPDVTVPKGSQSASGTLPSGPAAGLAMEVFGTVPPHQAVISLGQRAYELDGPLSTAIRPGLWQMRDMTAGPTLFVRVGPVQQFHAVSTGGQKAPRIDVLLSDDNNVSVRVAAPAALVLVRDMAWDVGWGALVSKDGAAAQAVPVTQHGLVQQVRIPQGNDVVTFRYRPPHLLVATVLSGAGLVLLIVLLAGTLVRLRGRRRDGSGQVDGENAAVPQEPELSSTGGPA